MINDDTLQRFLFEKSPIRGEIVHLNASFREILTHHSYPLPVQQLLGETLAATTLLSAILKFSGWLILQVHGEGPVNLLVAQVDHKRHIRGLAKWQGDVPNDVFAQTMVGGRLAITINPGKGKERYQGIVELKGDSLAKSLETYFAQSEQLLTFIYLTADQQSAAGLLLQALPGDYDRDPGLAWEHLTQVGRTLTSAEMLHLSNREILRRLFHEEDLRIFDEESISFYCNCTRARMERAILTMGYQEAKMLLKNKFITVTCEFCNRHHNFDAVDVEKIFSTNIVSNKTKL